MYIAIGAGIILILLVFLPDMFKKKVPAVEAAPEQTAAGGDEPQGQPEVKAEAETEPEVKAEESASEESK